MIRKRCKHEWKELDAFTVWCRACGAVRINDCGTNVYHTPKSMIERLYPWEMSKGVKGKRARRNT